MAEGVESCEIAHMHLEMGCDALQGHYFGQALAPARVSQWIAQGYPRHAA
jgi:EAL domain-containing protein (putative c-di-GMP-specific phosphodiesterase class I)